MSLIKLAEKKAPIAALLYLVAGVIFDYSLFVRNAPTGVKYSPTLKFIAGWPYYVAGGGK